VTSLASQPPAQAVARPNGVQPSRDLILGDAEAHDFSKMKGHKYPYVKYLKQPVTVRLDRDTVTYFKSIAEEWVYRIRA
jgi:uncharacterized protein (DUF4415 family)